MASPPALTDAEKQSPTTDGPSERGGPTAAMTPGTPDEVDQLPKDVVFGLLSNQRRRWVLRYLAENGPNATLGALAEHIASIENDKPVAAINSSERKRVYVCLYQNHLPKLDGANVIDYNQSRGTVQLNAEADQIFTHLAVESPGTSRTEGRRQQPANDDESALGSNDRVDSHSPIVRLLIGDGDRRRRLGHIMRRFLSR